MKSHFDRRYFLTGLGASIAAPTVLLAQPPSVSRRPVARPDTIKPKVLTGHDLVAASGVTGAVSYVVADLRKGKAFDSRGAGQPLPPASVAKSLTALYALDVLGPNHRFETRVLATGPVENGVLRGDLVLAGGGDPTLQTDDMAKLAATLKANGLRSVQGHFYVWGGALPYAQVIDRTQPSHVGYNPAVSGLALNYNRVHFEWRRAGNKWGVTMDARSDRYRPEVTMARMKIVNRDLPVYTYADKGGRDDWTVALTALGKGGSRWLPVRKPDLYAGEVFQTMMRSHGIVLKSPKVLKTAPSGSILARQVSPPLSEILQGMLKYSTNLTAEMVGMAASIKLGKRPTNLRASARSMSAWGRSKLGLRASDFVDHSGLGDASRTTAEDLVKALSHPLATAQMRPLLKKIKMRNSKYKVIPDHPLDVRAKTGTLNFVSTLAGYAAMPDGREMAFAILTGDVVRRKSLSVAERERPKGGRKWNRASRVLQQALLQRWGANPAG